MFLLKITSVLDDNKYNFEEPNIFFRVASFAILSRGLRFWNKHTDRLLETTNSLLHKIKKHFHLFSIMI